MIRDFDIKPNVHLHAIAMTVLTPQMAHDSGIADAAPGQSRYGWLASILRGHITNGKWVPGSAIPAETQLAKALGVALGTMRQAIAVLVSEGLLERVHGRGTFVSSGIGGASLLRFFRFRTTGGAGSSSDGAPDEVPKSRIIEKRVVRATAVVANALGLPPRSGVLALTRLRTLAGTPCLFERIWLPLPTFDALVALNKSQWDDLLYPMYQRVSGVTVHRADDDVTFCLATTDIAEPLQLRVKAPCVRVERRALDMAGRFVELRHSFGDALSFHYTAHLR